MVRSCKILHSLVLLLILTIHEGRSNRVGVELTTMTKTLSRRPFAPLTSLN